MVDALYEPDHDEQLYTAVINGGITDRLAGRLAARYDAMDGWCDDKLLGEEGPDKVNWYARGSLLFDATDGLVWRLLIAVIMHNREKRLKL